MGFSLKLAKIEDIIAESDARTLRELLHRHDIAFSEDFDLTKYEDDFYDWADYDGSVFISHNEGGWSWWLMAQTYLYSLLGDGHGTTFANIHAGYGVAVPGDIEPQMIGSPVRRPKPRRGLLQLLGVSKPSTEQEMKERIANMALAYAGEYENLHVVSGTRLLRELEEGVRLAGLADVELQTLYDELDDQDEEAIGRCFLAITYKFLKMGMEERHLVWWVK